MYAKPLFLISILITTLQVCPQVAFAQKTDSIHLRSDNIDQVLQVMTTEEKCSLLVGAADEGSGVPNVAGYTRAIPRVGIPQTVLSDGPAGLRLSPTRPGSSQTFYCTGFPDGLLLGSRTGRGNDQDDGQRSAGIWR